MFAIVLLSLFLMVMIGVGIWGMKKTVTLNDYFLGGRSIGPWISALAFGTSYFSAVVFIGFAGKLGWGYGLNCLWIAVGNALVGSLLSWLVLARRTRRMTQNLEAMTMPEFLHERYQAKYMKLVTSALIFIFLLPYSSSVFKGLSYLFEANFNISYDTALIIMVAITGIYVILGGYFAITMTDLIKGFIELAGAIALVCILVGKAGGLTTAITTIMAKYPVHVPPDKQPSLWLLGSLIFMTSFGTWGMPQMVQKFYSIKEEGMIKKVAIVTFCFALIITFSAYFTGAMTHVFYNAPPVMANGKPLFDRFIPNLLTTQLPHGFMAVILLLVLSASMSTLSSLILISASSVAIDMYKGHINPAISKENSVAMMRFLSGIFAALSYFLARYDIAIIITLMSLSWGVIAGAFLAPYIYGLFWKGVTRAGANAGIITGITLAIVLFYKLGPANSPIASSIAMIVPFLVVPLVSFFTKPPDKELIEKAFNGI